MSATCVLVVCRECAGTGLAAGGVYQCEYCLGQMHVNVSRTMDGGVPDGETPWKCPELGPVPPNPLTLRTDARQA